jgi:hypothetical protein
MRKILTLLLLVLTFIHNLPVFADDPPPIPTPLPRVYSQQGINDVLALIEARYGIGFAFPEEWLAGTASEVQWFTDDLHGILAALDTAAAYLYLYGDAPPNSTPGEFFRQQFDRAKIKLDRASQIEGGFTGNTLPVIEDGEPLYYLIQIHPAEMTRQLVLIHELGHVLDGLLKDQPHNDFVAELGGEWAATAWIPGEGYIGNEELFPRAVAGPNEDFADTFANMLLGRLSESVVPVRYEFMREYLPLWLTLLGEETLEN